MFYQSVWSPWTTTHGQNDLSLATYSNIEVVEVVHIYITYRGRSFFSGHRSINDRQRPADDCPDILSLVTRHKHKSPPSSRSWTSDLRITAIIDLQSSALPTELSKGTCPLPSFRFCIQNRNWCLTNFCLVKLHHHQFYIGKGHLS